jgi:hypothetical protein
MIAIYHKVAMEGPKHPKTFDAGFEVGIITNQAAYELGGNKIEAKEGWPSPDMWGARGWTYVNLLSAENKFNELIGKKNEVVTDIGIENAVLENDETAGVEDVNTSSVRTMGHRGRQPKERHDLVIPADIEFSTKQLAELNKVAYQDAVFFINQALGRQIKFAGEKRFAARGKMSKMYSKI